MGNQQTREEVIVHVPVDEQIEDDNSHLYVSIVSCALIAGAATVWIGQYAYKKCKARIIRRANGEITQC